MLGRRIGEGVIHSNVAIQLLEADHVRSLDANDKVYAVRDSWTTHDGQFFNGPHYDPDSPFRSPEWANEYQTRWEAACRADDLGADHNILFAIRISDDECKMMHDPTVEQGQQPAFATWTAGGPDHPQDIGELWVKPHSGWGNVVMYASSNYDPTLGKRGPFVLTKAGGGFYNSERPYGMGMPNLWHVSFFFVYVELSAKEYYQDVLNLSWNVSGPPVEPPIEPPVDPPIDPPTMPPVQSDCCISMANVTLAALSGQQDTIDHLLDVIVKLTELPPE